MKKVLILLLFFSITVFASEQLPVSAVHASETLPNQGKNNYNEKNLIDKNAGSIWAATFKGKPITIELDVKAFEINQLRILNGYRRDQKSYENNSRAKKINIYANSKDNLIKSVVLKDLKWDPCLGAEFSKDCHVEDPVLIGNIGCSDICTPLEYTENIVFKPALRNVKKLILEVEAIYPGKKWKDLCISEISLEGYIKNSVPSNFKPIVGTFTDSRDGHKYKTIKINGVYWMAENLSYADKASYCYDQKQGKNSCGKGRVYKASAAKDNICPKGWRLPTFEEFDTFSKYFKSFLPNEAELLELYDEELSSNGFGMNFYNLDKLCNCFDAGCDGGVDDEVYIEAMFNRIGIYSASIPAETAFWIHPMIYKGEYNYTTIIPFVRFNPREGSYSPVGELLGCFEFGEDELHRKEFFVRCVK